MLQSTIPKRREKGRKEEDTGWRPAIDTLFSGLIPKHISGWTVNWSLNPGGVNTNISNNKCAIRPPGPNQNRRHRKERRKSDLDFTDSSF